MCLPFDDGTFDVVICNDAFNHLRTDPRSCGSGVVLKPGGRAMFTDPVVVTGLVSNEEACRSQLCRVLPFRPAGRERTAHRRRRARTIKRDDVTENTAAIAGRWHAARADDEEALVKVEGEERFKACRTFSRPCISSRASAACRESYLVRNPAKTGNREHARSDLWTQETG